MKKKKSVSFLGKLLFFFIFLNFALLNLSTQNISAETVTPDKQFNISNTQSTTVKIETSGPVIYRQHFFNSPACLVLNFAPQVLHSTLKHDIIVNRGMIRNIHCDYYGNSNWLKSLSFILVAKTSYQITENRNSVSISIVNTPEQSIQSTLTDELVIKDYMPRGWGSFERGQALQSAIKFVRIKRQMFKSLTNPVEPSVLVEKRSDDSVRVSAANLTPGQMITTGAKVLLNQPVTLSEPNPVSFSEALKQSYPKLPIVAEKNFNLKGLYLGFASILLGVLVVGRAKDIKVKQSFVVKKAVTTHTQEKKKNGIEELFLKEEELHKWSQYNAVAEAEVVIKEAVAKEELPKTATAADSGKLSKEVFNFPTLPSDIAERRRFPRADIKSTRGILNRALVGSKTQPFKNIRINDISKGGLSFQVKSRETKFKSPTVVKLYFSNSVKPVDLWVRVVWEKEEPQGEGKNVGVKFTRVPKETWEKIMESFGHRLG